MAVIPGVTSGRGELYSITGAGEYSGITTNTALALPAVRTTTALIETNSGPYYKPHTGTVRCRGLMVMPIGVGSDNNTFAFQLVGWMRVDNRHADSAVVNRSTPAFLGPAGGSSSTREYIPVIIWRGLATLSGLTTTNYDASATTIRYADTLAAEAADTADGWGNSGAAPTGLTNLSGFTIVVYSPGTEIAADEGRAWLAITDCSHFFEGFTIEVFRNSSATSANFIMHSIY